MNQNTVIYIIMVTCSGIAARTTQMFNEARIVYNNDSIVHGSDTEI